MAWYLRKSLRIGPVRFNLSKSGIGTSVGVKGFRVGVRPNGRSYLHAGRYGLYYRQELDGGANEKESITHVNEYIPSDQKTTEYKTASSQELLSQSRKELLSSLNKSYKTIRLDFVCGFSFLVLTFVFFAQNIILVASFCISGIITTFLVARWEAKRRTIVLTYDFEDEKAENYKNIILAFNSLATNNRVWVLIDSRNIYGSHESKLNAGAGNLINRSVAQIGEGKPPWVDTNINIPVLKAGGQALYMMPDGILVYDNKGVGFVEYQNIQINVDTTRFIEDHPPNDAKVIDKTWKHPNKDGGPDRRFKNNYEIPVCLYGELKIQSISGMFLYLMTSKSDSPSEFKKQLDSVLR